jgi:hypothetical protein
MFFLPPAGNNSLAVACSTGDNSDTHSTFPFCYSRDKNSRSFSNFAFYCIPSGNLHVQKIRISIFEIRNKIKIQILKG